MGRAVPDRPRVVGLAVALALATALASCGSPPDAAVVPTITASPTGAPTGSAPTGSGPTGGWGTPDRETTGFGEPSIEPTVVRTTTRDDGGTVTVSGPTVDNRYQEDFVNFSRIPKHCAFLVNEDPRTGRPATELDARVFDLRITQQTPAGSTAFRYYDPDGASDGCLSSLVQSVVSPCRGAVLPPADDVTGDAVGCPIGIAFSGTPGTDYTARFVVTLEVECTSPQTPPCDRIDNRVPTAAAPVTVRWNSGTDLHACLGTAGGPGHAESRGLCVHEEPTTDPTSTDPTSTDPTSTDPTSTESTSTGPTS